MTFYNEWIDFVSFPLDPDKCHSREQRLDTSGAISAQADYYTPELGTEHGALITKESIGLDDDEFEKMQIGNYGHVLIWTRKRVWMLMNVGMVEQLKFMPRHPEFSHF